MVNSTNQNTKPVKEYACRSRASDFGIIDLAFLKLPDIILHAGKDKGATEFLASMNLVR
jgi:hypothetical protein